MTMRRSETGESNIKVSFQPTFFPGLGKSTWVAFACKCGHFFDVVVAFSLGGKHNFLVFPRGQSKQPARRRRRRWRRGSLSCCSRPPRPPPSKMQLRVRRGKAMKTAFLFGARSHGEGSEGRKMGRKILLRFPERPSPPPKVSLARAKGVGKLPPAKRSNERQRTSCARVCVCVCV